MIFHLFPGISVSNRRLKNLLVDHYGENICFTYPRNRQKSQMFYSANIKCADMAEFKRSSNSIKECAEQLRGECKEFEFDLEGTYNLADNCEISYEKLMTSLPDSWVKFFNALFPHTKSKSIQRRCNIIFQIVHYMVHNGKKKNPLHVSLAELFHDESRSKLIIDILNKLGLCISYEEVRRVDFGLANRIINAAGSHRVPVPLSIEDGVVDDVVIHGAMDNFDDDEATSSGIGGSHDTILMLFQNRNVTKTAPKILS